MIKLNLRDSYHSIFWEESKHQIECIEKELLNIESKNYDMETLSLIFRMAHSLKGASLTMEIPEIMRVAHVLEDMFTAIKTGTLNINSDMMTLMFDAVDTLWWLHELLTSQENYSSTLIEKIETKISDVEFCIKDILRSNVLSTLGEHAPKIFEVQVSFDQDAEMLSVKAYIIIQVLSKLGSIMQTTPNHYEDCDDVIFNKEFQLYLKTDQDPKILMNALDSITELKKIEIKPHHILQGKPTNNMSLNPSYSFQTDISSVRISMQKLNLLINLVGELTLNKEILFDISRSLKKIYGKNKQLLRLEETCEDIQFLGSELQDIILNARLIPLDVVFSKFPRMIRDLAVQSDKIIQLEIEGQDQGIDKNIIEELADPLMHLLRNAVDHGIEQPEIRKSKGKSTEGHIKIHARQGENQIIITIEDDGHGIDMDKIKVKALSKQLISIEEASHLNEHEWLEFIFKPGFSTATNVTTISGRGVGLDVVKSNLSKINGHLDIESKLGIGTKFTIRLPSTMSIMKVLLVKEGEYIFGIPTAQILEVIRLSDRERDNQIYSTEFSDSLIWHDSTFPLLVLSKIFEITPALKSKNSFILVLATEERKLALTVGNIIGEQEVVIKPMQPFIGDNKIFGRLFEIFGVSILGNGHLAQMIDCSRLNTL